MTLQLQQIRNRAERLLQDESNRRWSPEELNDYIFDAQHEFVRLTEFPLHVENVNLVGLRPDYPVPADLMTVKRARVRNRSVEIPIISPTVLDEATSFLYEPVSADWRSEVGPIRAVVLEHQSAANFRVYPFPSGNIHAEKTASFTDESNRLEILPDTSGLKIGMFAGGNTKIPDNTFIQDIDTVNSYVYLTSSVTSDSVGYEQVNFVSSDVFSPNLLQVPSTEIDTIAGTDLTFDSSGIFVGTAITLASIRLEGVRNPPRTALSDPTLTGTALDADVPIIGKQFHEALVFGCVERAYLKENELRNINKAGEFRRRFLEFVAEAQREEPENRTKRVGGANRVRMKVNRRWV